jgi:proline utilization trans-activator
MSRLHLVKQGGRLSLSIEGAQGHCFGEVSAALTSAPFRPVSDPSSYLRRLEKESKRLHESHPGPSQQPTPDSRVGSPTGRATASGDDMDMLNPLFDKQSESRRATEPGFIGEASCAAFNNRLLQCLDANYTPSTPGFTNYFRPPTTRRVPIPGQENDAAPDEGGLPDRMHARLLLNLARSFIGNYHPLFLEKSFMAEVDAFYRQDQTPSQLWLCKFLALMALGEVYSNRRRVGDSNRVPGTAYYVRAVQILPDSYEEPSLLHVEVLTLLVSLQHQLRVQSSRPIRLGQPIYTALCELHLPSRVRPSGSQRVSACIAPRQRAAL